MLRGPDHIAIRVPRSAGFFRSLIGAGIMTRIMHGSKFFVVLGALAAAGLASPTGAAELETVVVTGRRVATPAAASATAIGRIDTALIGPSAATHINEIAWRVPGAWISRGSGQEHLTAIRSPVLTGAGSCGAFLFLEDGIPIRPAGFCNVNQLFEINTAQAHAIEIARGPLSAVWGANAVHGAINVVQDAAREPYLEAGFGPDDYYSLRAATTDGATAILLASLAHDGGYRATSGYDEGKFNLLFGADDGARFHIAATKLQQETAGFVVGTDAYRDDALRKTNPNPEAYRDAEAVRASVRLRASDTLDIRAYARHSRMAFLQHFLPGQPLERNGQDSAGLQLQRSLRPGAFDLVAGLDFELATGEVEQSQARPTAGSAFLRETRPAGRHYDYRVDSAMAAIWASATRALGPHTVVELAARAEYLGYDYDNRLSAGNLRDDGSACGFGGCLYNRPADRSDSFFDLAPRIALIRRLGPETSWRVQLARGFRPPQSGELYRLQRGQDVADLDSELIDSIETGIRLRRGDITLDATAFWMEKRDSILRDAEGFNISAGRSTHAGIETDFAFRPSPRYGFNLAFTLARHRYAFDRVVAFGEPIRDGNEVDTAPEAIASARIDYSPTPDTMVELEAVHLGSHYTDAANTRIYPGHTVLNLRLRQRLNTRYSLGVRIMNLADRRYAERADFAFGNDRYFPGRERALYFDLRYAGGRASTKP